MLGDLVRTRKSSLFYDLYNIHDRDKARRDFGSLYLNCGVDTPFHFNRYYKESLFNFSGLLHLALGEGDAATVENNFFSWQQRLTSLARQLRDTVAKPPPHALSPPALPAGVAVPLGVGTTDCRRQPHSLVAVGSNARFSA